MDGVRAADVLPPAMANGVEARADGHALHLESNAPHPASHTPAATSQFDRAVQAHLRHYLRRVEDQGRWLGGDPEHQGRRQLEAVKALGAERDNLILALETAVGQSDEDPAVRLTQCIHKLCTLRSEMQLLHEQAKLILRRAQATNQPRLELEGLMAEAHSLVRGGHHADALSLLERGQNLALGLDMPEAMTFVLILTGKAEQRASKNWKALETFLKAFELAQVHELWHSAAVAAGLLGTTSFERDALAEAEDWYERAYDLQQKSGHIQSAVECLGNLAALELKRGRIAQATVHNSQAIQCARELQNRYLEAQLLHLQAGIFEVQRDSETALKLATESLGILEELGEANLRPTILENIKSLSIEAGLTGTAATLLPASD